MTMKLLGDWDLYRPRVTGRDLDWEGCFNARDLGLLPEAGGGLTRWGAVVRADSLDHLAPAGWSALVAHGIRTLVDLRNHEERTALPALPAGAGIGVVHVPLDDVGDTELWEELWARELDGTPLFYGPFLARKPERCATAVAAVARAGPGGVVVHCGVGRDRTGLVSLLLLALAGVEPEAIAADYERSAERLPALFAARGEPDQGPRLAARLARDGTTAREAVVGLLGSVDVAERLRAGGLGAGDMAAVRARLRGR